ncbi:MAG: alpha-hydroxy acid oxidase [Actinomycetota bacterium]
MGMLETLRSVVRLRRLQLDPVERRLQRAANVDDLRTLARRRLPAGVFDYIDGGAEDERTLGDNSAAFSRIGFRPRVLVDVDEVDTTTTVLGRTVPVPLVLSPTGFGRIACSDGELAVARAAGRAGVPFSLSTLATRSLEDVAGAAAGPKWFQVYVWRDRGMVVEMLDRAKRLGYEAILVTVDTAAWGRRERDVRRGFTLPPQIGLDTFVDGVLHPGWTLDFLRHDPISFPVIAAATEAASGPGERPSDGGDPIKLADFMDEQFDRSLTWDDLAWFRDHWDGPIVLKGVGSVADAVLAADHGLDAVALSNHGGRQLDDAPAPIDLVAPVREAVGDRIEVYCDGGVRRGSDVVKAVALGATAAMTGRSYFYALGAGGERGVDHVLALFDEGIRRTMALLGAPEVASLTPDLVEWRS